MTVVSARRCTFNEHVFMDSQRKKWHSQKSVRRERFHFKQLWIHAQKKIISGKLGKYCIKNVTTCPIAIRNIFPNGFTSQHVKILWPVRSPNLSIYIFFVSHFLNLRCILTDHVGIQNNYKTMNCIDDCWHISE